MIATRPGVLAVTTSGSRTIATSVRSCLATLGHDPVVHEGPGLVVATWGADLSRDGTLVLSRTRRRREHELEAA